MTNFYPVIMCGGAGTRLWPASDKARPKQFHSLVSDKTVFQETVQREMEILRAVKKIAQDVAAGILDPQALTEGAFAGRLDTGGLPDPDLVLRTSGETRTSNFLPWQAAYAEYEFTGTLWPDFTAEELSGIIARFGNRERRFGGVLR